MTGWQKFLDSLATKGGQILLLSLFVVGLLGLVVWITSRDAGDAVASTTVMNTFSAFSGALLGFLTGTAVGGLRKTDGPPDPPKVPTP